MVADLPTLIGRTTAIQYHRDQTTLTVLFGVRPSGTNSRRPFSHYFIAHTSPLLFGHRPRGRFEVKVRLAGPIFPDDFVEATMRGDFKKLQNKCIHAL
jgi:hypothetical protein